MTTNSTKDPEVVRWYTRARRFPQLIGKTPTGGSLWGGPYTFTQVGVFAGVIVVASQTAWLWGHFGTLGNLILPLGVAYGLTVLAGKLPIASRNPLSMAVGVLKAFTAPAQGNLGGAPLRVRRPRRVRSRLVITNDAPTLDDVHAPPRERETSADAITPPPIVHAGPATTQQPTSATTGARPAPALSGVQRLLASATTSREED